MNVANITIDKQLFHYRIIGSGSQYIFAFHGAKQTGAAYEFLTDELADYTIVAVDLPYHGQTRFRKPAFTSATASDLFHALKAEFQVDKVHLLAYSIGGRVALSLALTEAASIASLVLVAPDGVKDHAVFNFATRSKFGHRIFRRSMHKPKAVSAVFSGLKRMKLLKPSVAKFFKSTIENPAESRNLYKIWMSMSALDIDLNSMVQELTHRQVPIYLIVGKYDKIIPLKIARQIEKRFSAIQLTVLEKGHHLLVKEFIPVFKSIYL